ncbi:MAG: excisionase [Deltaproteobacteria bacterium]|nr:excisionase [Deltaproteobacteria bacterium]
MKIAPRIFVFVVGKSRFYLTSLNITSSFQVELIRVQYLVRLLDEGRIPFRKTGTHRRVRMESLLAYKRQRDRDRMTSLDELSQLSQDFGGYDEIPKAD